MPLHVDFTQTIRSFILPRIPVLALAATAETTSSWIILFTHIAPFRTITNSRFTHPLHILKSLQHSKLCWHFLHLNIAQAHLLTRICSVPVSLQEKMSSGHLRNTDLHNNKRFFADTMTTQQFASSQSWLLRNKTEGRTIVRKELLFFLECFLTRLLLGYNMLNFLLKMIWSRDSKRIWAENLWRLIEMAYRFFKVCHAGQVHMNESTFFR